jgi:ribonuclease D
MDWPFLPAVYIDHDDDFRKLIDQLAQEPLIAFDTESNSLHAYKERVCLIQISTWTADYIVDPLRVADLSPLGGILSNPAIEKVFHAAEYDLMCLKRDYGFTLVNLFDTMIAARIVGFKAIGLNKLLAEYCGIDADKSHQRDDWGQRPLSEEGLLYAQMDTHFLPQLRDILWAKLEEKGSLDEALETFTEACNVPAAQNEFDPDGYWRIGIPNDLTRRQIAILRELYLLRDRFARDRDVPPFKVFNDHVLIALAQAVPASMRDLENVRGMPASQIRRYGRQLLNAIDRGKRAPLPHPPARHPDIHPAVAERFTALRDWRKQRAEERGVESDVIISKDALWSLAQREPVTLDDLHDIEGLGPWRLATYGQALLDVIRQLRNGTGE